MANEFIARNGLIAQNNSIVTGSLTVTQGITGSLFGTSSWAQNASTASFVNPLNQNVTVTGSLLVTSKVGIGTANPSTKLHVEGNVYGPVSAPLRSIIIADNTGIDTLYPNSIGLYAKVQAADGIAVYGNSVSSSGFGGYFEGKGYFSGNVGIGTSSPSTKLDIVDTGSFPTLRIAYIPVSGFGGGGNIDIVGGASDYVGGQISWKNGATVKGYISYQAGTRTMILSSEQNIDFYTNGNSRMYLNLSGDLGIGTGSPTAKLHVRGAGATSATTALLVQNSSLANLLTVKNDGFTSLTGSLSVSQGITGSLFGSSSYSTTASFAQNTTTASYALNGGVTQIVAGTNVTISPTNGLGTVTINSTGGGGSGGTDLGLVQAMVVGLQNIF